MSWAKDQAKTEIENFFKNHGVSARRQTSGASDGKIYELFCLVETLVWLKSEYGVHIKFIGKTMDFKASPGNIDRNRSYFEISANHSTVELHTDIEIKTLGSTILNQASDNSGYHETDLVVIAPAVKDGQKPAHDDLFLGVECKAHANFQKQIVKQVLGIRRELSFLDRTFVTLDVMFKTNGVHFINANPGSLYWLAFTDPKGMNYRASPSAFGIEFKNWTP